MNQQISYRDPQTLTLHPVLKRTHQPERDTPEWHSFKLGLDTVGIDGIPPILITSEGKIMDGGRRWRAAKDMQWERIACLERPETDVSIIIIDSLIGQRSLTRGAKVFLAMDLIPEFVARGHERRLANLSQTTKIYRKPLQIPKSSYSTVETVDEFCALLGVGRNCYFKARQVRDLFYDPNCKELAAFYHRQRQTVPKLDTLADFQREIREEYEHKLLSGEYNLWNIMPAAMGRLTTVGKDKIVRLDQLELWEAGIDLICKRTAHLKLTDDTALKGIRKSLDAITDPDELQNICNMAAMLTTEAKARLKNSSTVKVA